MSLSEGKMFTIEALNRIEGFVWPEGAAFGEVDGGRFVYFYASDEGIQSAISSARVKQDDDPMTLHVQITREEFESVDGWVRDSGYPEEMNIEKVQLSSGGYKWRYHKPQKKEVKPEPESIETMIRRYKDAKENKRAAIDKLNQAQADVEQAEALEDSLFMAIEAWAESHGFDIRVLSESEERFTLNADLPMPKNPIPHHASSLVITDWRDLRVGDVVWWSVNRDSNGVECEVVKVANPESKDRLAVYAKSGGKYFWIDVRSEEWKFIRRPEKK